MVSKVPLYTVNGENSLDGMFRIYRLKGVKKREDILPHAPFPTDMPHRHNFFEIFVFVEGAGDHIIDFEKYPISDQSIHVVSPFQTHLLERERAYSGYLLAFNREFHAFYFRNSPAVINMSFFRNNDIKPILNPDTKVFSRLIDIIEQLKWGFKHHGWAIPEITKSYLNIFLLIINELFKEEMNTAKKHPKDDILPRFLNLIEDKFSNLHQVKDYAQELFTTTIKLNRVCSQVLKKNASELIMDRIILEAKRLLVFSDKSNKEIAFSLGYSDPSYFSRVFKKKTGRSPSEFRGAINQKYQQMA